LLDHERRRLDVAGQLRGTTQLDAVGGNDITIDDAMNRVMGAGGTVVVPKRALVGVGWSAYCKDTEGNIFGLSQTDPQAR